MKREFKLGQNSLDVCKTIVNNHSEISVITLVAHEVHINWRQLHQGSVEQLRFMLDGFEHFKPIKFLKYSRKQFNNLSLKDLPNLEENEVWSLTSKINCFSGKIKHIPMMNFHPENDVSKKDIKKALRYICGDEEGILLESGRFFHYYGDFLLNENQWVKFMAEFLMPCLLVSSRYIGHRLHMGYCTLRLTSDKQYKPLIPKVIEIL